jgi:hypothetical protein
MGISNNGGTIDILNNTGSITTTGGTYLQSIYNGNNGNIGSLSNSGSITSTGSSNSSIGIWNNTGSSITRFTNSGSISVVGSGSGYAILNSNIITTLTNSGSISGAATGVDAGLGIYNYVGATITTLTNTGSILGASNGGQAIGIYNSGTIGTLNNSQGGNSNSVATTALTYIGVLPTNYNIIIRSADAYGQFSGSHVSGSTNFGIYAGSLASNNTKYTAVLSGLTASKIANKSGIYDGYSWTLVLESGSTDTWDLIFGNLPSVANTNQSLVNTASALQGTYTLQNSVMANSFSYDCTVFGANDVCVSVGGRNTQVQAADGLNNTSALLIAAYRPHLNYRIGAYADQNLSVSNPGGAVNLGNNTPLIGLFGAWNERLDGTGMEIKVSAAYGQKNTTITRSVVGIGATGSEAGSGSSTLNSQGAQITSKYGFALTDKTIVSPYVGMRYTQNNMGGYTEGTSATVTTPLTYSALNTNATTALAGVGASYRGIPKTNLFASAGVETDTNTTNGTYSATNTSIGTLTPVNFNANPVKTRPTATLGAYYDVAKNQRVGITGIYRQEAYQAVSTTTVMATYTVGL